MGESCHQYVTMVITTEQKDAIKLMFKEKNWPCLLQVLSDETVADIIDSGFTDVFPVFAQGQDRATDVSAYRKIESEDVTVEFEAHSGSESSDTIPMETVETNVMSENEDTEMLAETKDSADDTSVIKQIYTGSSQQFANNRKVEFSENSAEKPDTRAKRTAKRRGKKASSSRKEHQSVLQCIDCSLRFPSQEGLWKHRNYLKHPLPTDNIPTKYNLDVYSLEEYRQMGFIKCEGCDVHFLGKRRQMKHFYVVHRDLMPTPTCPICCKEFQSYGELLKHKREEGHRDSLSSLKNYQCDLCGKHMTSYSNFVQHKQFVCGIGEKEMEKIRIHACDVCGKLFKSPRHVRRHKKISHFKVPEMCDICGTVCQGRKALDVHKKRHDVRNKKHACGDCGKAFFSDSKLQEHVRTHTKEKPFKCPLCTYTCAVKPNVHKHAINVHKLTVVPIDLRKVPASVGNKSVSNAYADSEQNRKILQTSQNSLESKTLQTKDIKMELPKTEKELKKTYENTPVNFENNHVPASYVDSGLNRNMQEATHVSLANKHIPNAYIDYELNINTHRQTESNIENDTANNMNNLFNSNMQGKLQVAPLSGSVPVTYAGREIQRNFQGKPQTSLENETCFPNMCTDNELNRSTREFCQTTPTTIEPNRSAHGLCQTTLTTNELNRSTHELCQTTPTTNELNRSTHELCQTTPTTNELNRMTQGLPQMVQTNNELNKSVHDLCQTTPTTNELNRSTPGLCQTMQTTNELNRMTQQLPQMVQTNNELNKSVHGLCQTTPTTNELNRSTPGLCQTMQTTNELNRSTPGLCQTTQSPYNASVQARVEYNPYSYQCRSQNFQIEKTGFQPK